MLSLPPVHGRFPVGVTTFATPVRPSRRVGNAQLKSVKVSSAGRTYALNLEEVAFAAYYPADTSNKPPKSIDWLVRPLKHSLTGISNYSGLSYWLLWPIVFFFGSLIKIPVYRNAPLLRPEEASGSLEKQWPLVIFSHGLGGSRTTYSQFCSRLAASGRVVLALEHRDGTGIASIPKSWGIGDKSTNEPVLYLREEDVFWKDNEVVKEYPKPLRGEQLNFRRDEVYIMYETFQKFLRGDAGVEMETLDGAPFDKASWTNLTSEGASVIKHHDDITFTGHSFGSATGFSLLATQTPQGYQRIPISKLVLLDPWMDPLPSPGPELYQSKEQPQEPPKVLVINSEAFTLWKDHFSRLQDVMSVWEPQGQRILTILGSQHISFSDFAVLPGLVKGHGRLIMNVIGQLSLAFLDDTLDETLKEGIPTTKMTVELVGTKKDGTPKKKLAGEVGHVVVS
ncbi:hypothetical protein AGABI1DRAFT_120085 [Agaricus bisporus var. burnettii JB137-S8]|uniref:Putative phospholipase n=1 Tax=Agaricus bisporus var. burnettii (strain JB137-S8 / ATCC MYA-4627 / FGSC 10392) TaxID=597362 RepID=K5VZU5_AGABU|nr:uncharacterized protein AGABI1DRAFT_120085 [Agaricus bisporus var. burnettii JB137-S8]EKM80049.1 hypothetical protein AGABI1DRAFT_120085 [Agaricus bisporus var. burnettii JB137-S8]